MPDLPCPVAAEDSPRWSLDECRDIYHLPFNDLLYRAQTCHRARFDPNTIQLSTLLNIKTGGCPEDCAYCPQSARYNTGVTAQPLLDLDAVRSAARQAKINGATRFCMGAAWRQPRDSDIDKVAGMIAEVNKLGMESCVTLGMLTGKQATRLKQAGLHYYNHNIDSSEGFYESIISTRKYQDRIETLEHVRSAGIKVCCGGIVGMGEAVNDRIRFLATLANLQQPPQSVPINCLVRAPGTPLESVEDLDPLELVRTIATARILMPGAWIRLSAGRNTMSEELQALCFHAGANSIFYGEKLLTTDNRQLHEDRQLLKKLGMSVLSNQPD